MAVDIIRLAMNQAVSDDTKRRKKWSKYKNYWAPNDRCDTVYWETAIAPPAVIGGDPKQEEEAVQMPARAPEPGRRSWQIDLDSAEDDDDDPPARTVMKKKMKASGSTSRSARR